MIDLIFDILIIIAIITIPITGFPLLKEMIYRILFELKNWKKEYEEESQKGYWDYINEMKDKAKKDQE